MLRISLSALVVLLTCLVFSQSSLLCDSVFRDSGGFQADYSDNEDIIYYICPNEEGSFVTLRFDFVDIAVNEFTEGNQDGCWDFLTLYNGPDTLSPFLAETLCGEVSQSGQFPSDPNSLLLEGDEFTSTHPSGCLTVRFRSDDFISQEGWEAAILCSDPCATFEEAPVDLSKSFNPVNGIQDRVQLKWYKESPQVKYSDEDAAMCDIKAWAVKNLDPNTGQGIGPVIQNPDTISLVDRKKTYRDGSPRSIFKWPLFFRAEGADNSKRVEPNTRYKFKVRCECGFSGDGLESPWSSDKFFNTPDFDPNSGMNSTPDLQLSNEGKKRVMTDEGKLVVYPNPSDGSNWNISFISFSDSSQEDLHVNLMSSSGQLIEKRVFKSITGVEYNVEYMPISTLSPGLYTLHMLVGEESFQKRLIVD